MSNNTSKQIIELDLLIIVNYKKSPTHLTVICRTFYSLCPTYTLMSFILIISIYKKKSHVKKGLLALEMDLPGQFTTGFIRSLVIWKSSKKFHTISNVHKQKSNGIYQSTSTLQLKLPYDHNIIYVLKTTRSVFTFFSFFTLMTYCNFYLFFMLNQ